MDGIIKSICVNCVHLKYDEFCDILYCSTWKPCIAGCSFESKFEVEDEIQEG